MTAPLFGILAAVLFLFSGSDVWGSRWLPGSLALTHLLTLGFMMMVMTGALYQFIPVMLGRFIPGGEKPIIVIHISLIIGTLSLSAGFLLQTPMFYWMSFVFLGLSMGLFTASLIALLVTTVTSHLIIFLIRVLSIVLIMTVSLGLMMALGYAIPDFGTAFRQYTDIHALWGLVGWVVLLIMAVSSQVIPMFFVTPEFSVRYLKTFSVLLLISLIVISLLLLLNNTKPTNQLIALGSEALQILLSMELVLFSTYTLLLINKRQRKLPDQTINFFLLSLSSLLMVVAIWWSYYFWEHGWLKLYTTHSELLLGVVLIYGLALSAIIGMLQKIVPFLIYLNLQNLSFSHPDSMTSNLILVPNMKQVISSKESKIQFFLHISSFFLLLVSIFIKIISLFAGAVMLLNFIWLTWILYKGFYLFLKNRKLIRQFPEVKMNFGL
ncbi:MAG: hypothetical protein GY694_03560 [Gammaproteobacteria bacterium]|nr:hypothetical protein [Gammaproteobacteria bacterium]